MGGLPGNFYLAAGEFRLTEDGRGGGRITSSRL